MINFENGSMTHLERVSSMINLEKGVHNKPREGINCTPREWIND